MPAIGNGVRPEQNSRRIRRPADYRTRLESTNQ
jgi:hypothetical protein